MLCGKHATAKEVLREILQIGAITLGKHNVPFSPFSPPFHNPFGTSLSELL
jgi:hypothetical protein